MTTRLDRQRPPAGGRTHKRAVNTRLYQRGYDYTPHATWGETAGSTYIPPKSQASNGTVYPADPAVTAQDAPNAAKLVGLGYIAVPQTNWTTGQKITIGTYNFNWTGSAWAAGIHA